MNVRALVLPAVFFFCMAGNMAAQNAVIIPATKADEPYLPLKKCWEYAVENIGPSSVSAENGTVYVADTEGRVRALSANTGTVNWVTELGGRVTALRAVPKIGIAVLTSNSAGEKRSVLRLLGVESGLVKYSLSVEGGGEIILLSIGTRLIVSDTLGAVLSINAQTGEILWRSKLTGKLTAPPAGSNEYLALATDDRKLAVISLYTGKTASVIQTERNVTALEIRENGMIVTGDDRGRVTNYRDIAGTVWWRFKSGARVGTILETPEGLLVGSFDNFLYLLSKYSGDVRWKRRLEGRIISSPALFDGRILTASSSESNAYVIDLESGKAIDQIPFGEDRYMLAKPLISEGGLAVFSLVDGIAVYSASNCAVK